MKYECKCALRAYMAARFARTRKDAKLTQAAFSEILMVDTRSYVDLEHGRNLCGALTFVLYLVFLCKDADDFVQELRKIILDAADHELPAS